jgi:hypothetical protein
MAAKLTRLTHKIAIQLHLVSESCTICSSHSRRPVRELFDTPSYCEIKLHHNEYGAIMWRENEINYMVVKMSGGGADQGGENENIDQRRT